MKTSYKKRLLNQLLIASAIVMVASLSQNPVFANSIETSPVTENIPTSLENTSNANQEDVVDVTSNLPMSGDQTVTTTPQATSDENQPKTEEISNPDTNEKIDKEGLNGTETNSVATESESVTTEAQHLNKSINLAPSTVYMSEKATLTETIEVGDKPINNITWTLDGKALTEWKTWDLEKGDFKGVDFITVEGQQTGSNYQVVIKLEELFGSDLSLRTPSNIRRTYRHYMKDYILKGVSEDGNLIIEKILTFRPYASFRTHDEMLAEIEDTKQNASKDRVVQIDVIGKSAQNRDIKMAIVAKDQASIDKYLMETTPLMLTQPDQMIKLLAEGKFDYKLPILINNTHADEQPGIDVITSLFRDFAKKDVIEFKTTDESGATIIKTLHVPSLLNKFIFLFNFTENPDGDVLNLRSLVNGLDPNRDAGFQVNPETRATIKQIHKWNPISIFDIHGFVKGFLIEPATPPHDPNFEYDLISKDMLENAHAMGRAGISNSKYESYVIPKIDWGEGWDDSFSGYTAVYGLYHGILGHTVEIPEANEESFKAGFFAVLGGINYLSGITDHLMNNRLIFYSRGVNKVEDPKAEEELVGPNGEIVGRIKKEQPKFFPDYYVIPMSLDKHNDLDEAFKMIEYLTRNGVHVSQLIKDVGQFKAGDLIVDMAQAKRGFANHVLYSGSDESKWGAMYAELVVNFPNMKGFKAYAIFDDKLFKNQLTNVTWTSAPRQTEIDQRAPFHFVSNNSADAVRAINKAIKDGHKIFLTDDGFIMDTKLFANLLMDYPLHGEPLYKKPTGEHLKSMKVYAPSHYYRWAGDFLIRANAALALENMGFELVEKPEDADAIVLESDQFDASIFGKKPVIIVGGGAMQRLEELNVLPGFNAEKFKDGDDNEGLMKAIIDDKDPLTSGYLANELFYSNSGNWIEGIPNGFKPLVKIADKDFYVAGWWPGHESLGGKTMAIAGMLNNQPLLVYAGNPANKLHTVHFFRWLSNGLFGDKLAKLEDLKPEDLPLNPPSNQPDTDMPITPPSKEMPEDTIPAPQNKPSQPSNPIANKLDNQIVANKVNTTVSLPKTGEESGLMMMIAGVLLLFGLNLTRKKQD